MKIRQMNDSSGDHLLEKQTAAPRNHKRAAHFIVQCKGNRVPRLFTKAGPIPGGAVMYVVNVSDEAYAIACKTRLGGVVYGGFVLIKVNSEVFA